MAESTLLITQTVSGLRRDITEVYDDQSDLANILEWIRTTAQENRPDEEGVGDVSVTMEVGTDIQLVPELANHGPSGADDDPVGYMVLRLRLPIPEDLAYDFQAPSNPLSDFMEAIFGGINAYVDSLPGGGAGFMSATGIGGEDCVITLKVGVARTGWAPPAAD